MPNGRITCFTVYETGVPMMVRVPCYVVIMIPRPCLKWSRSNRNHYLRTWLYGRPEPTILQPRTRELESIVGNR